MITITTDDCYANNSTQNDLFHCSKTEELMSGISISSWHPSTRVVSWDQDLCGSCSIHIVDVISRKPHIYMYEEML